MENNGISFLNKLYSDLHMSDVVMHTASLSDSKDEKVQKYMDRLERIHERAMDADNDHLIRILKEFYYEKYVIKREDIPDSYFKNLEEIAFEMGNRIKYDEKRKAEEIKIIIDDQKYKLSLWLDYFLHKDTFMYPMWMKYWAFQGMLQLGKYDKEQQKFTKRTKQTATPFVDLNREAIGICFDVLDKIVKNDDNISDNQLKRLVSNGSFGKVYAYVLNKLEHNHKQKRITNEGVWKRFPQGSDCTDLVKSLEGQGTGWCTAGESTAKKQLEYGDFHIYYSYDENNQATIPRIAIRMEKDKIGEIRGTNSSQNLEPGLEEILNTKLKEFPDAKFYRKKVDDMKQLTNIYKRKSDVLTAEELKFIYEIDSKILGFGFSDDTRIAELLKGRNIRTDLSKVFNCREDQISFNNKEALSGSIIYHYGDLDLKDKTNTTGLKLPKRVGGGVNLNEVRTAKKLLLPEEIDGILQLNGLKSPEYLSLPEIMNGGLDLNSLRTAKGLVLPRKINGVLSLGSIRRAKGLVLPEEMGGLYMRSLVSAEGLTLPRRLGGTLYLESLRGAKGLVLPEIIEGALILREMRNADGLVLPNHITGYLDLSGLRSLKGLIIPNDFHCVNIRCNGTILLTEEFRELCKMQNESNSFYAEKDSVMRV